MARPRKIENSFDPNPSKTKFSEGRKSAGVRDNYAKRLHIDTRSIHVSEKVGIGTTSPIYPLHIISDSSNTGMVFQTSAVNSTAFNILQNDSQIWQTKVNGSASDDFQIQSGASTKFSINSSGDVNIIAGTLDMNTHKILNVVDPTANQEVATKKYVDDNAGGGTLDALTDTTLASETKNDHLIYNGSAWVNAPDGTTFTYSCDSFSDGETTTKLIGSGTWKAAEAITFTATYSNGPPTTANIQKSINGASYATINTMDATAYTSGNNTDAVAYPASRDQYLRFRLESTDGIETTEYDYDSSIYFRNNLHWGESTTGSGFSEANIEALSGSTISNSYTTSRSINAGASDYLVYAHPSSYTTLHDDGFVFASVTCPMQAPETVSITNSAGYTENYKVYASNNTNLGSSTLTMSTSSQLIDPLYYGITTKTSTYLESDVEGLATNSITNDNTQVWNSVTTGSGEYMLFAFPTRLGIPAFWVGGFEGGFESPETVAVTNVNGYQENYYVWRSTNANLGATVVETK